MLQKHRCDNCKNFYLGTREICFECLQDFKRTLKIKSMSPSSRNLRKFMENTIQYMDDNDLKEIENFNSKTKNVLNEIEKNKIGNDSYANLDRFEESKQ